MKRGSAGGEEIAIPGGDDEATQPQVAFRGSWILIVNTDRQTHLLLIVRDNRSVVKLFQCFLEEAIGHFYHRWILGCE